MAKPQGDFHPDYGVPNAVRIRILYYMDETGSTASEVARVFGFHPSTIYAWKARLGRRIH